MLVSQTIDYKVLSFTQQTNQKGTADKEQKSPNESKSLIKFQSSIFYDIGTAGW